MRNLDLSSVLSLVPVFTIILSSLSVPISTDIELCGISGQRFVHRIFQADIMTVIHSDFSGPGCIIYFTHNHHPQKGNLDPTFFHKNPQSCATQDNRGKHLLLCVSHAGSVPMAWWI